MRQAAGAEVPERLEGVNPDVTAEDKCQGLTPNKKVCQKDIFPLASYSQRISRLSAYIRLSHRFRF